MDKPKPISDERMREIIEEVVEEGRVKVEGKNKIISWDEYSESVADAMRKLWRDNTYKLNKIDMTRYRH